MYDGSKIATVKRDGLYVSDSVDGKTSKIVEQLESCEDRLRVLIRQRNQLAHKCDFLFHVLEGKREDEQGGLKYDFSSDKAFYSKQIENITDSILRGRAQSDYENYVSSKNEVYQKPIPEISKEADEIVEQIKEIESQIITLKEQRRKLFEVTMEYKFHKVGLQNLVSSFSIKNKGNVEQTVLDYRYLLTPAMRSKTSALFLYPIQRLPASEQFQFLNYIKTRKEGEIKKVREFVAKYGENGFRTFLSLEYGKDLGDDIVALGEKLPKEEPERIFQKYGELVDAATEAETYVQQNFPEGKLTPEMVSAVRENLLKRGRDMLASFSSEVKGSQNVGYELAILHIEQELGLLRADAALFAATFKELSRKGESLNLSELRDVQFEQGISPESFSETDKERMRELYRVNYAVYPEFQKTLLQGFESALKETANRFYVLRYKGEIEGFYRLGIAAEDRVYFGAFNMNPKYAGSGLGEALMQQSLDVRAKDAVIEANCIADKSIAANYIERGFIGTCTKQVEEPHLMYITRHDTKNSMFASKALTSEEIMRTCGTETGYVCKKIPFQSLSHSNFDFLNEYAIDGTRHVLTRYIRDKSSKTAYLVFEKTTDEAIEEFSRPEKQYRFLDQS